MFRVGGLGSKGGLEGIPAPDLRLNFDSASIGANAAPDDAIDFSRASQATFTDADGLVKYAPHNLCLQSEDMGTTWNNQNLTISTNALTAPDGTTTADLLTNNSGGITALINQGITVTASSTDRYFAQVYVKRGDNVSPTTFTLNCYYAGVSENNVTFDIPETGEITTIVNPQNLEGIIAENVGNGWYRVGFLLHADTSGSATTIQFRMWPQGRGQTTGSNYVWGCQLSKHKFIPVGNPYIKTTSAAVYGARLEHEAGYFLSSNQPQNLILKSEDLSVHTLLNASQTANATTAPDGTTTADKLVENNAGGQHGLKIFFEATNNTQYTFSVFYKNADNRHLRITFHTTNSVFSASSQNVAVNTADLDGDPITFCNLPCNVTDEGSGWFRLSATATSIASGTGEIRVQLGNQNEDPVGKITYTGDNSSGVFLWGMQLEVGSSVGTYVKTEGLPYYGGGATQKGLLIEEQRVNQLVRSEELATTWFPIGVAVTSNNILSPDGNQSAEKLTEDSSNGGHRIIQTQLSVTSGKSYTLSVFAKTSTTARNVDLRFTGFNSGFAFSRGTFNLTTGVATNNTDFPLDSISIEDYGNGWFRCIATKACTGTTTNGKIEIGLNDGTTANYAGDGSSSIFLWGAQFEEGTFATSYIPTTSATVTRSADLTTMGPVTGTNIALQSEDLSSVSWSKTRSTVSANAIASPDGLTTADTLVEDTTASSNHFANQQFTFVADKIYVYSFYAKAISSATNRNIAVQVQTKANTFPGVVLDPADGTASATYNAAISAGIQNVGNGWVRGHIVFDSLSGGINGQLYVILRDSNNLPNYTGDGSSGMHIWGAQLEKAPTLITGAEDFTTGYTVTGVTVTANQIAAPNGETTADLMKEDSSTGAHRLVKSFTVEGKQPYTFSVFVKAASFSGGRLFALIHAGASAFDFTQTNFNLSDGTIDSSTHESASINDVGNGWFRVTATETSIGVANGQFRFLFGLGSNSYEGDNTSGVYLWGAQIEKSSSVSEYPPEPTKYLPTYASTNLPFVGYNQNQGTINSEFTALGSTEFSRFYDLVDNTDALNEKIFLSNRSASNPDEGTEGITTGGSNSIFNVFDLTPNVFIKYSRAYKTNDSAAEIKDGTSGVDSNVDTSVTLPTTINELGIGVRPDNGAHVGNFVMKRFHYYASRLKDDFLKRLR